MPANSKEVNKMTNRRNQFRHPRKSTAKKEHELYKDNNNLTEFDEANMYLGGVEGEKRMNRPEENKNYSLKD